LSKAAQPQLHRTWLSPRGYAAEFAQFGSGKTISQAKNAKPVNISLGGFILYSTEGIDR
jgi:hypothetical protein